MEELFLAAELAFTQFPMKTKEMLDQPLAGIRVRLLYLLLEFGDRAVPPQNILAKLFLVGEGYGSAHPRLWAAVGSSRSGSASRERSGMAAARDRAPLLPVSQEADRDEDAGNAAESERYATTRYVHKYPKLVPGQASTVD